MKDKSTLMNPFPGLRSFRSDEDYLFFGREEQTQELMARLERNRFIAVVGTSGRGKSSLVRCGLLSRLQGGGMVGAGAHWEIAVMHPGGDPLRHLAEALLESGLHDPAQEDAVPHLLATLRRSQFGLIEAVRQALRPARGPEPVARALPPKTNFLLVVDQFEEIFRYDEAGRAESEVANDFIAMLREASAQTEVPIYVVTTMRSDFIGDCSRFEGLAEAVNRGEYLVPGLNRDQFKAAIEGPIRVAGGQIAPRLLQRLLNDLGEEQDQLPCLQHALMRTWRVWQNRADAPALDLEDYAQVGKMSQALSVHADEVYSGLASDHQRALCAAMFKALTVEGSEKRGIRRPRRLQTLCGILGVEASELTPIIDAFRHPEVSFLMPPADVPLRDTTVIDLSHESLMRVWTRLRDWVDDEAKSVGIFRRLSESATLWREGKSGFYRDPELSIARAWVESSRPNAVWAEQYEGHFEEAMAFLRASEDAAQEEVRAQEAARQHELEQARALAEAERRRAEEQVRFAARLKWLVRGLGLVAMVAVTAMIMALAARRQAQASATLALQAEANAQAAEDRADGARGQAERLVTFLLEDFHAELEPTGRLDVVAKLAHATVAYFDGLPAELRSNETRRSRAIALLREGEAIYSTGRWVDGGALVASALKEFEELYASGDRSVGTVIGLAAALRSLGQPGQSESMSSRWAAEETEWTERRGRAVELLRPLAAAPNASVAIRIELADALRRAARSQDSVAALSTLGEARDILTKAGALNFSNLKASSFYAAIVGSMSRLSGERSQSQESEQLLREALDTADKVLARQPGNLHALRISGEANYSLSYAESVRLQSGAARRLMAAACEAFELGVRFNPSDKAGWEWVTSARRRLGEHLIQEGRVDEAIANLRIALDSARRQTSNAETLASVPSAALNISFWEASRGNRPGAESALDEAVKLRRAYESERAAAGSAAPGSQRAEMWDITSYQQGVYMLHWHLLDYPKALEEATKASTEMERLLANPETRASDKRTLRGYRATAIFNMGRANLLLGRWAEAEAALRTALEDMARGVSFQAAWQWLTIALVRQGRMADAATAFARSELESLRRAYSDGDHSLYTRARFARGLYAFALLQTDNADGREKKLDALRQAMALLDESTAEARQLSEQRELRRLIEEELKTISGN